jgi:galactokinase
MTERLGPFPELFARPPEVESHAPGRVNLMGEHTDYNGGWVLPVATPMTTRAELAERDDRVVEAASEDAPRHQRLGFRLGEERRGGEWLDFIQGAVVALRARGIEVPGFSVRLCSDVPLGSGLSSSASLLVAVLRGLRTLCGFSLDDRELARVAHHAEKEFVGAPVGMMDPMAASLADARAALFLDARNLEFERVPLPARAELLVIDSGVSHRHADGDYRVRRRECEAAAAALGVPLLRDVSDRHAEKIAALPETLRRRVRHVTSENARVLEAVAAMRAGDVGALGRLFDASHASQRDDFEVSVPAVDTLIQQARGHHRALGARLTGGGFGGAIVVLVQAGAAREVGAATLEAAGLAGLTGVRVLIPVQEPS